jgi:putative solute:sodium symporter small subunit
LIDPAACFHGKENTALAGCRKWFGQRARAKQLRWRRGFATQPGAIQLFAWSHHMRSPPEYRRYWRANLKILAVLLSVWFLFSSVLSIFLVEWLNEFRIGGFPLGFWMAQQGSIYVFVLLILIYTLWMRRLDRKYDVHEEEK